MECSYCGYENKDAAKFCGNCGKKIQEVPKYCPECGAEVEGAGNFCLECGYNLADSDSLDPELFRMKTPEEIMATFGCDDDSDDEYEEDDGDCSWNEDLENEKERITSIVDKYIRDISKGNTFYDSGDVKNSKYSQVIQNVRSNIAKDTGPSDVVGFIDTTVFGKGKAGLVFTTEALYEKSTGCWFKVPYYRMWNMECNGKKIDLIGTDDCGTGLKSKMDISIDNIWYNIPALKDCLDEIFAII
ncbi:MAG: zinc ribbon domain-containing protein [Spirochaetaceae bacterium]|nr:zinc ribbon domain-containing protein [Spirochaetaceae bacterium]